MSRKSRTFAVDTLPKRGNIGAISKKKTVWIMRCQSRLAIYKKEKKNYLKKKLFLSLVVPSIDSLTFYTFR